MDAPRGPDVPIACSLTATGARAQLGEWQAVLAQAATSTERVSPVELTFSLRTDLAHLGSLIALSQREKACCPFFDFAISIDAGTVALRISVGPDATAALDGFADAVA